MRTAALVCIALGIPLALVGQSASAITGTVTDTAGLGVRQARVRVLRHGPDGPRLVAGTVTASDGG